MGKRSHEALRARDRGRSGIPLSDSAADHGAVRRTACPPTSTLPAWLRRYGARLLPPSAARPYWQVRDQDNRYLAAGRTPQTAMTNAMSSRFVQNYDRTAHPRRSPRDRPAPDLPGLDHPPARWDPRGRPGPAPRIPSR